MSVVTEMGFVYAVHKYGTRKFQILQEPQCGASNNRVTLNSVFHLSICDMHFDVCVVQSVDVCKLAERGAEGLAEDVLREKLKA